MIPSLVALALALASALAAVALSGDERRAFRVATGGAVLSCAVGLAGAVWALATGEVSTLAAAWALPLGELRVGVDGLTAFFLACASLVAGLAGLHGLSSFPDRPRAPGAPRRLARAAALYALTLAAMQGVLLARDGILFLVAWEVMTLASWGLVAHEAERPEARRAAMTYLIASHAGAAALYVLFALLAGHAGGYGFDRLAAAGPLAPALAGTAFGLALAGFGAKAAFFPLHLWAPDAYPAAPPHAAALLSGAVSKMGIYGIARLLTLLGPPEVSWGVVLVLVGAATAVVGALNAMVERDLKRLVAGSSVENLGIVALGLGVGLLGRACNLPLVAYLGFAGALLHVLGHGLMKSLLFLLAGDVAAASGTRDLDRLGGLARRMPVTAGAFLVGAVSISALPPGAGFVSEWLILTAALRAAGAMAPGPAVAAALVVVALTLASGLAAAAFVKAHGIAFLGAPRSEAGANAADPRGTSRGAILALVALVALIGLAPGLAAMIPARVAGLLAGVPVPPASVTGALGPVTVVAWALVAVAGLLALVRARLLRGREVRTGPVWGCGYEAVGPRMQYTASGFPDPAMGPLGGAVARTVEREGPNGYFPVAARFVQRHSDAAGERLVVPAVRRFVEVLGRVRALQAGRLQLYLLYVLATLIALLAWQIGFAP